MSIAAANCYNPAMLAADIMPHDAAWAWVALLGLAAGTLGGLLGVGGSVIMIPGLTILFGRHQHLYQASAMIANVAVAIPAALRHHKAGATVLPVLRWMLPAALIAVLIGVWLSNLPLFAGKDGGIWLGRILALFMAYVIYANVRKLIDRQAAHRESIDTARITPLRSASVGGIMGSIAGLLGIGGGALAVPMQQVLTRLPLRSCIANSSAVMVLSASLGACFKTATLGQHSYTWTNALALGAVLAPTCWIGGRLGAALTHRLPLRQVRLAFILLMAAAFWKMAAIPWNPFAVSSP